MPQPPNPEFFRRIDEDDDELFYRTPRFVVHIDDAAIAKVADIYANRLPVGADLLDLMSSWRSHLPPTLQPRRLVGVGLNQAEMEDNPALTETLVQNLNRIPRLPFADATFDGAVMTVSIQYVTRPLDLFAEVGRVLRPAAPFIVTFSNRMFPTKAVALWHGSNSAQRVALVSQYFLDSGTFTNVESINRAAPTDPPSDPIWAVVGYHAGASPA